MSWKDYKKHMEEVWKKQEEEKRKTKNTSNSQKNSTGQSNINTIRNTNQITSSIFSNSARGNSTITQPTTNNTWSQIQNLANNNSVIAKNKGLIKEDDNRIRTIAESMKPYWEKLQKEAINNEKILQAGNEKHIREVLNISDNEDIKEALKKYASKNKPSSNQNVAIPKDTKQRTYNRQILPNAQQILENNPTKRVLSSSEAKIVEDIAKAQGTYDISGADLRAKIEADEFNKIMKNGTTEEKFNAIANHFGNSILGGAKQTVGGIANIGTTLGADVVKTAKYLANDEAKEQLDKWYNDIIDTGRYINDEATYFNKVNSRIEDVGVKAITGATNTVSNVATNAMLGQALGGGSAIQALQVGGSSAQEVLNEDREATGRAILTGTLKGFIAKKTEDMFDANILTKGETSSIQKLVNNKIAEKFKTETGRKLASKISGIAGENIEEFVEDNTDNIIDKIINNKDLPSIKEWAKNTGETVKATTLSTIILDAIGLGGGTDIEVENMAKELRQQKVSEPEIQKAKEFVKVVTQENLQNQDNQVINQETKTSQNQISQAPDATEALRQEARSKLESIKQNYDENSYNQMQEFIETAPNEKALNQVINDLNKESERTPIKTENKSFEDVAFEAMNNYEDTTPQSPMQDRNIDTIGKETNKNAYQYDNPKVKPYFQDMARQMREDLAYISSPENRSTKKGGGTKLNTNTKAIDILHNEQGYSYFQIAKGLQNIMEDNGKENNAISKKLELLIDEQLREGYNNAFGKYVEPNQDYINTIQENKAVQLPTKQEKPNIINKKVNEYIDSVKDNFKSDINIKTQSINEGDVAPLDYNKAGQSVLAKKAQNLVDRLKTRVFKNNNEDIHVSNGDIRKSISETLKNPEQNKYKKENVAVFSQLDKVIENAKLLDVADEHKGRDYYSDYKYYVSNVYLDGNPFVVEFDTRMQDSGNGTMERHFRLERVYPLNNNEVVSNTVPKVNSDNTFLNETTSINNSISQNERNVKSDSTNINNMQNNQENMQQFSMSEQQKQNNFEYKESKNSKVDTFRQDASKYWDNSEKTTKLVNTIEKIINDKGYNIRLDDTLGDNVNGRIRTNQETGETEITINPNSSRKGEFIIGHELTHAIETEEMTKLVKQRMEKDGNLKNAVEDLKKLYKTDEINAEVLADISGQLFGNQEFINNLSVEKPNVFKRIYDKIVSLANKIIGNSSEALFIKDLKNKWEKAYRENTNNIKEEQYSIGGKKGMENAIKNNPQNSLMRYYYNKAQQMAKQNIDNETIRQQTNWFQDKNGDWKFEFSDKDMALKNNIKLEEGNTYKLEEILKHDTLFEIYPELKDYKVKVKSMKGNVKGSFNKNTKTINLNNTKSKISKEGTLIHEIQHAIQNIEGFEGGKSAKGSKLAYYNSLGEIEADNTKQRFLQEKRGNLDRNKVAPESSKTNPRHRKLDNYLQNRTIIDKMKDGLYNYFDKLGLGGNISNENFEVDTENDIQNQEQDSGLVDGRRNIKENSEKSSFSLPENVKEIKNTHTFLKNAIQNETNQYWIEQLKEAERSNYVDWTRRESPLKWRRGIIQQYLDYKNNQNVVSTITKDNKGRDLTKQQQERYKDISDKIKDENGNIKRFYHGTQRGDRVGNIFDPNKATSGPMAMFTDNQEIAQNYSRDKQDTSLSREYNTEWDLFKANNKDLDSYWRNLSYEQKQKMREKGSEVGFDDDYELRFEKGASKESFGSHYEYELRSNGNNPIKALYDTFINGGYWMGEDIGNFKKVLDYIGVEDTSYLDPYKSESKVYEVYLNLKNPFDTSEITKEMLNKFEEASKKVNYNEEEAYSADMWDKTNVRPEDWIEYLKEDIENGTTHSWTRIPDWVTDVLKAEGYDGIVDTGGKHGGQSHQVAIPFYSEQIKNIDNENPTDSPDIRYSKQNNNWQDYLESNYKSEGTTTDLRDIRLPMKEKQEVKAPIKQENTKIKFDNEVMKTNSEIRGNSETPEKIAKILSEPTKNVKPEQRTWAILKANFIDKGAVFEKISQKTNNRDLQGKYDYTLTAGARGQYAIGNDRYVYTNGKKTLQSKSLTSIMDEVGENTQAFNEYMYHQLNVDRMTLDERFGIENKPVFGESITADVSRAEIAKIEEQHPEFKEYANDVYKYLEANKQELVDRGVISQETSDFFKERYPHYVPIQRATRKGNSIDVALDTKRTGINSPIKKAKGGNQDINPLFQTIASQTLQTYRASARNNFGLELKNTLQQMNQLNENRAIADIDDIVDTMTNEEQNNELLQPGKKGENPTFTVFEDGKKITYDISQDMYDALKPKNEILNKLDNTKLAKAGRKISNFRRGVLTEYNPIFSITNAIKDAQDVLINSQHSAKTYAKFPEAYAQIVKKGYWYNEYIQNGGAQNSYFTEGDFENIKSSKLDKAKNVLKFPLEKISQVNNVIEMAPRLAEYIVSRQNGANIETAMLDASRVTTNFKAGGDITKFANRNGATFLNASIQGFQQQVRNIQEANMKGLKGWTNLALKYTVAGLPALLLNNLFWDDDDDYEQLQDYVKDNYYVIAKLPNGNFLRIPKGRMTATIQKVVSNANDFVKDGKINSDDVASTIWNDLKEDVSFGMDNLAPNNPIDNNILSPIIQVAQNKTWYGDDLVPQRLQDVPDAEQADESTDKLSRWLGEKLGKSPKKINYLLDQYSGGIGDVLLPLGTPQAENNVIEDKFTTDPVMKSQYPSDFFSKVDELNVKHNSIKATDEDILKYKYISSVQQEVSSLYKQKREIQASDKSDATKKQELKEVQKQINKLAKDSLENVDNVKISGESATIGDKQYYKNKGTWTKLTDKEKEKLNGTSTSVYSDYKNATNDLSDKEKIQTLRDSNYSKSDKSNLYEKTISTDKYYPTLKKSGIDIDEYMDYKLAQSNGDFTADKKNGKTVMGSGKKKVLNYLNKNITGYGNRLLIAGKQYSLTDSQRKDLSNYINKTFTTQAERTEVYKQLKLNFVVNGNKVTYK